MSEECVAWKSLTACPDKHLTARMGLFEDIDRAWFAVDNRLFLWDYTDG